MELPGVIPQGGAPSNSIQGSFAADLTGWERLDERMDHTIS